MTKTRGQSVMMPRYHPETMKIATESTETIESTLTHRTHLTHLFSWQAKILKTDIINQGASNNRYRGVNDNIFDKVFRGVYEEDIRQFDPRVIRNEYNEELKKEKKRKHTVGRKELHAVKMRGG